ncbi:unnamed protein product [Brassica oleracea]
MAPLPGEKRVSTALLVMVIIVAIALTVRAKNVRTKSDQNDANIEAAVMLKRYSYESVKKRTNSFAHVLGKGGSGTVCKGKLPDTSGRDIALKILKESKGDGEEFINELASMSRASHVNIVSLFGFCNEGSNRAIIYEFMPNGSLDKFIELYRFISKTMSTKMDWKVLYNIALGVAHGLEYLHSSCVSKIKQRECHILANARGTVGYIAPEVFSKKFGEVSHKSDVYSYGMVVLEMIGAKNMESAGNSRSENVSMYFPDWIYEDLERKETMSFSKDHIMEQEEKIAKKMALVGLWCIQTSPSDRPPMKEVVEMLEGSLEAIHVPT